MSNPPTADKPQSKLWWNDGSWWADMWKSGSGWHIYRLDRGTATWVDTGLLNDSRGSTLADTLWDGTHLYIASHVVTASTEVQSVPSESGKPAKLYRYSYSNGTYTLESGFPTTITDNSSESMTIDEDSTGAIWATWTQVAGSSSTGFTNTVYVNYSAPGGTNWASPFILPVSNPNPTPDDISAVVAFKNRIGVMWSDQAASAVWWATRTDGTAPTATSSWHVQPAIQGKGQADDHLNLKTLQADDSGRVFAAVKTGLDGTSSDPTLPQLRLLVFKPGTGSFSTSTISTTGDCVTRPQILLDTQNNLVHAFQTAPSTTVSGCAYSGVAGSIYEKTASMDDPVFGSGRGTPVIQDAGSANMNNVTTTKQSVNSTTGIVVMASDHVAKRYWFSDRPLGPAAPVASFTANPTSGTAPLNVSFTDTSTGSPASWSWTFGDSGTSTSQNPTHTYATAGTYTAKLTATNAGGSSSATKTITVRSMGFVPLTPYRILDTRDGSGGVIGPVGPGQTINVKVTDGNRIPSSGVSAVAMNITVASSSSNGFITAYAGGTPRPGTSNLNYGPGQIVPNFAITPVGADGTINFTNTSSGTVQLIADVSGYYLNETPAAPGAFGALTPFRQLDTRDGTGSVTGPVGPGQTINVKVTGRGGIPSSGVSAVAMNITVASASSNGFITAYAGGTPQPGTSNLNYGPGQIIPNFTITPVGADGTINFTNASSGTVQLIADTSGYYVGGTPTVTGAFGAISPYRFLDTRDGTGSVTGPVGPGQTINVKVTGRGGIPSSGVSAVAMNITVTSSSSNGFITAYAGGTPQPGTSNLNYGPGQIIPNFAIATVGADGTINFTNSSSGTVQLIADVSGYHLGD